MRRRCDRRGSRRGSPISCGGLLKSRGEGLDRAFRLFALRRREVIAAADSIKLAAKARERPPVPPSTLASRCPRLGDHRPVLRGDRLLKPGGELALLGRTCRLTDPDRGLATGLENLIGEPLELLAISAIERKGDQPVEELRDAEPLELPPDREPRRRRLARKLVCQEDPAPRTGHRSSISRFCNRGYSGGL